MGEVRAGGDEAVMASRVEMSVLALVMVAVRADGDNEVSWWLRSSGGFRPWTC